MRELTPAIWPGTGGVYLSRVLAASISSTTGDRLADVFGGRPARQQSQRFGGPRAGLGAVDDEHQPGSALSSIRSKLSSRSPTTWWLNRLMPVVCKRTLCAAQRLRNSSLLVASSPTRSVRSRSFGLRSAPARSSAKQSLSGAVPVVEDVPGLGAEEHETGPVAAVAGVAEHRGVERSAQRIRAQRVESPVFDERRGPGHRVEHPLDARADRLGRRPAAARHWLASARLNRWARSASSRLRASAGVENALRRAGAIAALQAVVVVDAQPGERGDLLAAQARNTAQEILSDVRAAVKSSRRS